MLAPAREPRSSPCSTGFSFLPAANAFSLCSGSRRPAPSTGLESITRACEPGEGREDRSCALDPPQRRAERDGGGAHARSSADSGLGGCGSPSGRGSREGGFFSHPLLERVRVRACTRARSARPGQSGRCRAAGLTVLSVGVLPLRFQRSFPGPPRSVRLHRSPRVPPSSLSLVGSAVAGNRRGSCPKEADTPTLPPVRNPRSRNVRTRPGVCPSLPPRRLQTCPRDGSRRITSLRGCLAGFFPSIRSILTQSEGN